MSIKGREEEEEEKTHWERKRKKRRKRKWIGFLIKIQVFFIVFKINPITVVFLINHLVDTEQQHHD